MVIIERHGAWGTFLTLQHRRMDGLGRREPLFIQIHPQRTADAEITTPRRDWIFYGQCPI